MSRDLLRDRARVMHTLIDAALGAADIVMSVYSTQNFGTELKGPNDPVTRADKEANAFLLDRLGRDVPGTMIVSEESDPETFQGFGDRREVFFVDPVDGTRDFIERNGEFCIMIGLAEEGRATVSAIVCPAFERGKRVYAAAEGIGAFAFDEAGGSTPIRVSSVTEVHRARCAVSRFHRTPAVDQALAPLGFAELVPVGSSGIKGVRVATGAIDICAHPSGREVNLWDACAPDALVRAAGGLYTDSRGIAFDYRGPVRQGDGTIAAGPALHAEVVRLVASPRA